MKKLLNKTLILILILALILTLILIIPQINFTGNSILNRYSYTKAICDKTGYCEDYYIECEGKDPIKITSTGFSIQKSPNKEIIKKRGFCD